MLSRRSFLRGLVAAPAVVQVASLMPLRGVVMPPDHFVGFLDEFRITKSAWHHFAVTRHAHAMKIFVDGELLDDASVAGPVSRVKQVVLGHFEGMNPLDFDFKSGDFTCDYWAKRDEPDHLLINNLRVTRRDRWTS